MLAPGIAFAVHAAANLVLGGSWLPDSALPMAWLWHSNLALADPGDRTWWLQSWWFLRPVLLGGPWLERGVSADDPGFASAFLQSPVGEIVYRLTQAPLSGQVRFLKVSPGEVVLLVSGFVRSTTNPTTLHAWVSDLASIAEALEGP